MPVYALHELCDGRGFVPFTIFLSHSKNEILDNFLPFHGRKYPHFLFLGVTCVQLKFSENLQIVYKGFLFPVLVFKLSENPFTSSQPIIRKTNLLATARTSTRQTTRVPIFIQRSWKRRESLRHWTTRHSQGRRTENTPLRSRISEVISGICEFPVKHSPPI